MSAAFPNSLTYEIKSVLGAGSLRVFSVNDTGLIALSIGGESVCIFAHDLQSTADDFVKKCEPDENV
jgi:hypothetical protein